MEPKTLDEQISFRISTPMLKRLIELAAASQRKRADMVRILFIKGLQAHEREQKAK